MSDEAPATPICDKRIEVLVMGRRCVYVNSRRIAGGKPYASENLPYHTLPATLGEVLDAFSDTDIEAALTERRAVRKFYADRRAVAAAKQASAGGQ